MSELTPADIRAADVYEAARDDDRRHIADIKRHRRIVLADTVALVFENRDTVRGVVEEVVRTEHIEDAAAIAHEIDAFNAMLPRPGELSACLYVEVTDPADLAAQARRLAGIESALWLEIAGERVGGTAEELDVEAGAPALFHLRFAPSDAQRRAWRDGAAVAVGCDHSACTTRVDLSDEQRDALASDLS